MNVHEVGYHHRQSSSYRINRPNGSGNYVLSVIKSAAYFVLGGNLVMTPPNTVILYKKGTPQILGAVDGKYLDDWVHFELGDDEYSIIEELGIPFDTLLSFDDTTAFSEIIKSIATERHSQNPHKESSMQLYLRLLLNKISEKLSMSDSRSENQYYERFAALRKEIYLKPQYHWNIDTVSKKLSLSRSYIQHLYRYFFGDTVIADITKSRITYAKYLLESADTTVSTISKMCGYQNSEHFMRVFKKEVGVTPSEFRILKAGEISEDKNKQ